MDHIRQYDWCSSLPDINFVEEKDLDNCVIERILRNKFRDPMLSSDSEDEKLYQVKIDWGTVFKKKVEQNKRHRVFVPGLRPTPPYPKLSALTKQQHFQCLKVLSTENRHVELLDYWPAPSKEDYQVFQELKEVYLKEQKEYIEWAKTFWRTNHCIRALRPKPTIETIYDAEFKMKAHEMDSFPKSYEMAAQISYENKKHTCEIVLKQTLVNVNMSDVPKIKIPQLAQRRFDIMKPCPFPEICNKHPCRFILPYEKNMTVLPLTEIHRELAQYALDNGAHFIASESALKCFMENDRQWQIPLSVCEVITAEGDKKNVFVFGSDFSTQKKTALVRTYRAFRHLLEYNLIPTEEKARLLYKERPLAPSTTVQDENESWDMNVSSDDDDDEDQLVINEDNDDSQWVTDPESQTEEAKSIPTKGKKDQAKSKDKKSEVKAKSTENGAKEKTDEFYTCSCQDTVFKDPPPRSFKKFRIQNYTKLDNFDLIVHCSHKMKGLNGKEVISEPIPEFQIDFGGSKQSDHKLRSLALSLSLRDDPTLLNARVDYSSGDVITMESITKLEFMNTYKGIMRDVSNILYASLTQLRGLLPGHYVLQHEPTHGSNALLYATRIKGDGKKLSLELNLESLTAAEEAKSVKTPPVLAPVLLPIHKFRKILPCAFTPFENMLGKEAKKLPAKKKQPPQAIRWPKRKRRKNNKKKE